MKNSWIFLRFLLNSSCKAINFLVVSELTLRELQNAPAQVLEVFDSVPKKNVEFAILDDEAKFVAQKYIDGKAINENSLVDAQHIAIASINRVDVLVSWNFKHIVNFSGVSNFIMPQI